MPLDVPLNGEASNAILADPGHNYLERIQDALNAGSDAPDALTSRPIANTHGRGATGRKMLSQRGVAHQVPVQKRPRAAPPYPPRASMCGGIQTLARPHCDNAVATTATPPLSTQPVTTRTVPSVSLTQVTVRQRPRIVNLPGKADALANELSQKLGRHVTSKERGRLRKKLIKKHAAEHAAQMKVDILQLEDLHPDLLAADCAGSPHEHGDHSQLAGGSAQKPGIVVFTFASRCL
ncbi:hypothetical protein FISHEDRAFT_60711 [Fistulina hepatica ATCC 64428]|uniref:Uncharacterized protein n=1 Tax=Fistulina hepatica ATCC 64428 TaxID=1128425 RepID=A0A0D7A666_9AGAR|nr:hypothetical protein FISHEDRAFT_60711 [Fistulina hepatica ATCC 64428]